MLPEATIARRRGIPVAQVHGSPEAGGKRTVRWAAAVADVLIGVATPVCGMLRAHAGRTPVLSVHNGVGPWEAHGTRCEDIVVGSVGYVSRTKGTDLFLRAAELARAERSDLRFEHVGQQRLWGDAVFDDAFDAAVRSPALDGAFTLSGAPRSPTRLAAGACSSCHRDARASRSAPRGHGGRSPGDRDRGRRRARADRAPADRHPRPARPARCHRRMDREAARRRASSARASEKPRKATSRRRLRCPRRRQDWTTRTGLRSVGGRPECTSTMRPPSKRSIDAWLPRRRSSASP